MASYKSYKAIITQAELMAMPTETAATFMKKRASQSKDDWHVDVVDEDVEAALLARNDPWLNLALARYARYVATLKPLFEPGEPSAPLKLAVLSNTVVGGEIFSRFPVSLFASGEQAAAWLVEATGEELSALFENHNIDDSFLRDLLEGKKPWDVISDARLAMIVANLHRNDRMRKPYDDSYMDGYAEYSYGAVFNEAWRLAERVPVNKDWARALSWLYDCLETDAFFIKSPLDIAARWHVDLSNADAAEEEDQLKRGRLSHIQGVRKGLARLALRKDSKLLAIFLGSDDPALRSAAYSDGAVKAEQLSAAYERDGKLVFNEAMHNHRIWQTATRRDALKAVSWAVVNDDKYSDLTAANIFNSIRDVYAKKHPEWFKDEDDFKQKIEPSDEPATKADLQDSSDILSQPTTTLVLDQLRQSVATVNSRVGWVWWFSLGTLAANFWTH
jgi:hypothetical protein